MRTGSSCLLQLFNPQQSTGPVRASMRFWRARCYLLGVLAHPRLHGGRLSYAHIRVRRAHKVVVIDVDRDGCVGDHEADGEMRLMSVPLSTCVLRLSLCDGCGNIRQEIFPFLQRSCLPRLLLDDGGFAVQTGFRFRRHDFEFFVPRFGGGRFPGTAPCASVGSARAW